MGGGGCGRGDEQRAVHQHDQREDGAAVPGVRLLPPLRPDPHQRGIDERGDRQLEPRMRGRGDQERHRADLGRVHHRPTGVRR